MTSWRWRTAASTGHIRSRKAGATATAWSCGYHGIRLRPRRPAGRGAIAGERPAGRAGTHLPGPRAAAVHLDLARRSRRGGAAPTASSAVVRRRDRVGEHLRGAPRRGQLPSAAGALPRPHEHIRDAPGGCPAGYRGAAAARRGRSLRTVGRLFPDVAGQPARRLGGGDHRPSRRHRGQPARGRDFRLARPCMSSTTSSLPRAQMRTGCCGYRGSRPNPPTSTHVFLRMARNFATDDERRRVSSGRCSTSGRRGTPPCWRRCSAASARTLAPPRHQRKGRPGRGPGAPRSPWRWSTTSRAGSRRAGL